MWSIENQPKVIEEGKIKIESSKYAKLVGEFPPFMKQKGKLEHITYNKKTKNTQIEFGFPAAPNDI